MPPQRAMPLFENVFTYCREDDGTNSSIRQLTKDTYDEPLRNRDENKYGQVYQRRESNASTALSEDTDNFIVGDRVWVGGTKSGVIAFIGETQFGPGDWAGVVLDDAIGKNDGAVAGTRYFQCAPNKGIFSRLSRLSRYPSTGGYDYSHAPTYSAHNSTPVTPDRKQTLSSASFTSSVASQRVRTPQSQLTPGGSHSDVRVGDRVIVQSSHGSKAGVLRYYGTTDFGSGIWCGVELDDPLGKNDGSVAGVQYFDCAPKFGLFVPAEKVSRSPVSKQKSASCVVHPDGLTRQGTLESLRSTTSTVQTSATSGLRSNRKATPRAGTVSRPSVTPTQKSPLQEQLKEKDAYIKQLLKERELERARITTAATQADKAEIKLSALKSEYEQTLLQHELKSTNLTQAVEKLEKEKRELLQQLEEEKKRIEDLQFNFEEESITKSEIQALNEEYVEKLKNFEKVVTSQHASLEYDAHSSGIFTTESISEKGSSPNGQQAEPADVNEELATVRKMVAVLTEKNVEMKNECQQLHDSLEKGKLIDKSKEEMITSLRNEITSYQQLNIGSYDQPSTETLQTEIVELKTKLNAIEEENSTLKRRVADTNEKLATLEVSLRQKDDELCKTKTALEDEQQEAKSQIESAKNSVQFELDECKIKMEEMNGRIDQFLQQLSDKEKEAHILTNCIGRLCEELCERNAVISKVLMDNEETSVNIAEAVAVADNIRGKETNALPEIDGCPPRPKEKLLLLLEHIEQTTDNNVVLLKKLETLTEVIARKDALVEETVEEKEAIRNEFQESMRQKANELCLLESKYVDLNKVKRDIERQLKMSEENVRKLELLFSGKDEELRKEVQSARQNLEAKCVEYEQMHDHLTKLQQKLKSEEDEHRSTRETFEKERCELRLQIENVNQLLAMATEEKRNLRRDYIELQKLNELVTWVKRNGDGDKMAVEENPIDSQNPEEMAHRETIEKNVRAYRLEYNHLKKEIEVLTAENGERQKRLSALECTCRQFDEQKETWASESARLQEELLKAVTNLETEKSRVSSSENEFVALREKMEASAVASAHLHDLRNEYKRLEDSFKTLDDCKNKLETELKSASMENIQLKAQLDAANKQKNVLMKQADEYTSGNQTLNKQVLERERELAEVHDDLQKLKEKTGNASEEMNRMQEANQALENMNKTLTTELNTMKARIEELEKIILTKEDEMNQRKQVFEQDLREVTNANNEFKTKDEQFQETMRRQTAELQTKLLALQDELKLKEKAYRDELAELDKNTRHLCLEKESVAAQFETAKSELIKLKCNDGGGDVSTTKYTKSVGNNKIGTVEDESANNSAVSKDNLNNNVPESKEDARDEYLQLVGVREAAQNEVQFLNSVIVDMQRKNETLLERVQYLENIIPPDLLKPKKTITPRMFCDICDVFDLHETEDCPKQANSSPPPVRRDSPKVKPPQRPYCEICEVFGHSQSECNNDEDF